MAMAVLRSVATKMARAPPRLPYALEHSRRLPTTSRFSTSTGGSMPPSANLRGPQTCNKEVPIFHGWHSFMAGFIGAAPTAAYSVLFGCFAYTYFYVFPALDRIDAKLDAFNKELEQLQNEMRHAALDSMGSQIEARDVVGEFSKGQRLQASACEEVDEGTERKLGKLWKRSGSGRSL